MVKNKGGRQMGKKNVKIFLHIFWLKKNWEKNKWNIVGEKYEDKNLSWLIWFYIFKYILENIV